MRNRIGFAVCLLIVPALAAAQDSGVAGAVTDNTGGVLPGVTVEASSPALIGGSRVAFSDGQGRYAITALRPGTYTVTFTLPGFSVVVREGIELTAAFTAAIDVELRVGALEETVTVSGATPVIDVQRVEQRQVVTKDVLDALPMNKDWGATLNAKDAQTEELSYEIGAVSADVAIGGVRVNIIPKEGGNTFSGSAFGNFSNSGLQGDNLSQELIDLGLRTPDIVDSIWDTSVDLGGPLVRDRLWFHGAYRNWGLKKLPANTFYDVDPADYVFEPDETRPGVVYDVRPDKFGLVNETFGPQWQVPANILLARFVKFGAQFRW